MARIEGVPAAKAPLLVRIAYWFCKREVGKVITPIAIHAHHPRLLRGLAGMEMAQKAARTVDPALKTLVSLRAAMRIGCPFWIDIGSAVGRQQGVTEAKLQALADYENSDALSEVEVLALRYADAMTETPVEVPDILFDRLRRHFDERQLVELTSAIAWENYRARFDHAFGIESEGFSEGAFCPLPV